MKSTIRDAYCDMSVLAGDACHYLTGLALRLGDEEIARDANAFVGRFKVITGSMNREAAIDRGDIAGDF